jgi:hypothetical protein
LTKSSTADPRQAPEAPFKDVIVDRLLAEGWPRSWAEGWAKGYAEGYAEGMAETILRVLWARRVWVPAEIRRRVLSCTDVGQLKVWVCRAATAATIDDVFDR